ncbi:MAG TPA: cold shock domain-containing protein [Rubrobacteraceae bacterium]|nr:cold shock domain-containing protein [Rubrobacteraceae bacterium]
MADSKKRIALKPHMAEIRDWVDEGKSDDWIANALGTSASSVQSFRSRNDIYRRERGRSEPESVFEGVLDHGERDGWGMWFDPSISEDPIWKEHWSDVDSVIVKVAEDSIVLEIDRREGSSRQENGAGSSLQMPVPDSATQDDSRERGRVKWFDPEKGYGFLVRPTGEDLFVHHSEVEGKPSDLDPNDEVEYEVGQNDRGPNARRVRPVG